MLTRTLSESGRSEFNLGRTQFQINLRSRELFGLERKRQVGQCEGEVLDMGERPWRSRRSRGTITGKSLEG